MCFSSNFRTGVTVAIWTIVQTSIHIIWALCGYYFYVCRIRPGHYGLVILYLTYFYKDECGDVTLNNDDIITWNDKKDLSNLNDTGEDSVYDIVQTVLDNAVLPTESGAAWRTNLYLFAFIISDAIWIISAFLLFAGTCFQIRKCLSLLFYCPWLVVTALIIILDVAASVHFGLDIYHIQNFTTWLNFIGVENYADFSDLNDHELSRIIPIVPAISLCMLFSRIVIIWVLNIVNFFQIMNVAVMAFQDNLDGRNPRYQRKAGNSSRSNAGGRDQNLTTSASRIRSWQLFYGAIESTSTTSRSSSNSSDKDCNSNKSLSRPSKADYNDPLRATGDLTGPPQSQDSIDSHGRYISTIRNESSRSKQNVSNVSTYYYGYPDVAEVVDPIQGRAADVIGSLRGQMPWSYIEAPEKKPARARGYNLTSVPVNDLNRFRTPQESYKNIRIDNTEL